MIKRHLRYIVLGVSVFGICGLLSFLVFRQRSLSLTVSLADVQFRPELPRSADSVGELSAFQKWPITINGGGKLSRYLVTPAEIVQKGQTIAMIDEMENRTALVAAISAFQAESTKFADSKKKYSSNKITQSEYQASESHYFATKSALETAKQKMENSLVTAPAEGHVTLGKIKIGDSVEDGATIGQVEDLSKFMVPVAVPKDVGKEIPNNCNVTVSPIGKVAAIGTPTPPGSAATDATASINSLAEVHVDDNLPNLKPDETGLQLVFAAGDGLSRWMNQTVKIHIPLTSYKRVALVAKNAVIASPGVEKIPVLNSFGYLHWQNVSGAPRVADRIVIRGVDAKTFRVVIAQKPKLLTEAITFNVKPKVKGGR